MKIITNFAGFPSRWVAQNGMVGTSIVAKTTEAFLQHGNDPDAVFLVNCDNRLVFGLARAQLLSRGVGRPIVAVDMVLRKPTTLRSVLVAQSKRLMFGRVSHFLHYFRDVAGLRTWYGIGPERSDFVWFKANVWDERAKQPQPGGDYAICFGRSLRDFDTFLTAMAKCGLPGAIVDPDIACVREHGSKFTRSLDSLPANVRVLDHDLSAASQIELLSKARIVVVPILRETIVGAGISTILNAMALGKCVIASAGPGVTDIFQDELVPVPAEDSDALASAITRVWHDYDLRASTARSGWQRAQECGSAQDLFARIIEAVVNWNGIRERKAGVH